MENRELKPKRVGNYHHNGNPKHGLYSNNKPLQNKDYPSLRECPFCGYDGILFYPLNPWGEDHGDFIMWHAKCGICGATIRRSKKSEAIKDWNRRAENGKS